MNPRAIQRRVERLTLKNEAVTDADERFFARFRERRHRIRLASEHEVEIARLMGEMPPVPASWRLFAAIRAFDGARMRAFVLLPAGAAEKADSLTEEEAAHTFRWVLRNSPKMRAVHQQTAAAFGTGGGE
ncbi:hypothetical protein EZH22_05945 [Xanthobacter dioxanivorans]|uniref:Uncharacterized protein n=1 Tax=Xanthobacter dioxanivorans TaxID=2528964 RepID=A0A974PRA7_9HYPH|nr:hypothetical protein [Xanthobacter dioxanivorans]QRG07908.1 hypothetical protein EZH22_05945 [Xanthobacter dioxanivorans]